MVYRPLGLWAIGLWGCELWASGAVGYRPLGLWAIGLWGCVLWASGAVGCKSLGVGYMSLGLWTIGLWGYRPLGLLVIGPICTPVAIDAANEATSGTKVSLWHKTLYLPSVS